MSVIDFQIVQSADRQAMLLIAGWYFSGWHIPVETTMERLQAVTSDSKQFQVLMLLDGRPISTGGIYDHVGLLDKEPGFKIYKKWLALVYTIPEERGRGYGAAICSYIQKHSGILEFEKIRLFTDTPESLYRRLGWKETERLTVNDRNIVVMEKTLSE